MIAQKTLEFSTRGRGATDITAEVARSVVVTLMGERGCTGQGPRLSS